MNAIIHGPDGCQSGRRPGRSRPCATSTRPDTRDDDSLDWSDPALDTRMPYKESTCA